jgi:hypothetical protein
MLLGSAYIGGKNFPPGISPIKSASQILSEGNGVKNKKNCIDNCGGGLLEKYSSIQ